MHKLKLTYQDIPRFCQKLNNFNADFNIHNKRFIIDGKSLMGLYALNINEDSYLEIITTDDKKQILKELSQYICK